MSAQNVKKERKLVVVQMSGGNDYLNCVVPYDDPRYVDNRPNVRITEDRVLPMDGKYGFNPGMQPIKELFDQGQGRGDPRRGIPGAEPIALPLDGHLAHGRTATHYK